MSLLPALLSFALVFPAPLGVLPAAVDDDETEASDSSSDDEEAEATEEDEGEPFPWDIVGGAAAAAGGLAAAGGVTLAGAGVLLVFAPDADPQIAPGGWVAAGVGAGVAVVGALVVGTGAGVLYFTQDSGE